MPWEHHWVEPQTEPALEVLPEPPEGAEDWGLFGPKEVRIGLDSWHYCSRCKGWIPGHATASRVDTLAPLSGRRGTEFHCRRCGWQVGFSGMVS